MRTTIRSVSAKRHIFAIVTVFLAVLSQACDGSDKAVGNNLVLNRSLSGEPETLHPHKFRSTQAGTILRDLGEGLVAYAPDGELIGGMASEWSVSPDGTTYSFDLRPGVRWSTGENIDAEDFVRSFRNLLDPKTASPSAGFFSSIKNAGHVIAGRAPPSTLGVIAQDETTIKIELEHPQPYFLQLLAHPSAFPVHSSQSVEGASVPRSSRISNGAYVLVDYELGSAASLQRNQYYWDDSATGFDSVVYHFADESVAVNRFRAGDFDVTDNVSSEAFAVLLKERPEEVRVYRNLGVYYFGFNLTKHPFKNNVELRRALSLALDREDLTTHVLGRGESVAYQWVPPGVSGYPTWAPETSALTNKDRIAEAKRLYRLAGYGPDNPLSFELRFNTSDVQRKIAVAVQSMWREVLGARVTLVNEEFRVMLSNIQEQEETQLFRLSWVGDYNDAYAFLQLFESNNPSNLTGYTNPHFDKLMKQAELETNMVVRGTLLLEAEKAALADQPVIPLYFYVSKHLVSQRILGWHDNILDIHYTKDLSAN